MGRAVEPTRRELAILKVLWERGEATVREVYEALRDELPIVQNTVQAFLRTMEGKGLVTHRTEGRTFVYRPAGAREQTSRRLLSGVLEKVFDGAIDQLVASALSLRAPTADELERLRRLVDEAEVGAKRAGRTKRKKRGRR
jgi:predicted transcriptional regulator